MVTSRAFWCAPPDTGVPNLQLVSVEQLLSIEGALEIQMDVTFLRGKAPLPGADSPYQGEMSRRDKRGKEAVSRRLTERLSLNSENLRRCAPPWLPFQGSWLGAAETERLSQICNCRLPPAAPSFPSCRKRRGRKGALGYGLVRPASEFRQGPMFWSGVPLDSHLTGILVRAA